MKKDSRHIALDILEKVSHQEGVLDAILDDFYKADMPISKRDRSLTNTIVFGVLRWKATIDYMINCFSKRNIGKIDSEILNILRIGIFQIKYLDRIPDAAAVHSAVEMAKASGFTWAAGFVNAILRRTIREHATIIYPDKKTDPVGSICAEKSMPKWLVKRWIKRYGIHETEALCDAINGIPDITIRLNRLKAGASELEHALEGHVEGLVKTQFSEYGFRFSRPKKPIAEMAPFINGWFQVQDEAAQLVTMLLDPQPGETVLDTCAGLGGKTGHMAQLMGNTGEIIALDVDRQKLNRLETDMRRLGITMVKPAVLDITLQEDPSLKTRFDRILVDAPCTGLGVLRRNPDAKWNISKQNFEYYAKKQATLLHHAASLLNRSGVMVYAVCSVEPEENESVIKEFLNNHSDFAIDKHSGQLHGKAALLIDENGFLKTAPHKHSMDGFFAVRLKQTR